MYPPDCAALAVRTYSGNSEWEYAVRVSILSLILALAMPVATTLAQDSPAPPPGPDAAVRTVKGTWTNFEEQGAPAAGISDAEASLAFLCFPDVGFAMIYRASVPFPEIVRQAKTVHILFGELHDPKSGKGGAIIEGMVDPPLDDRTMLISGEGVDKMVGVAEAAGFDLRIAIIDSDDVARADNFSTKGSTAAIRQLKQSCGKS
jgi:hypothetical protein